MSTPLFHPHTWDRNRSVGTTKPGRYIRLTTQFRDGAGNGFAQVQLPAALLTALGNEAGLPIKPPKVQKEKPWTKKRLAVLGITVGGAAVLLALVVLALILSL